MEGSDCSWHARVHFVCKFPSPFKGHVCLGCDLVQHRTNCIAHRSSQEFMTTAWKVETPMLVSTALSASMQRRHDRDQCACLTGSSKVILRPQSRPDFASAASRCHACMCNAWTTVGLDLQGVGLLTVAVDTRGGSLKAIGLFP